MSKPLLRKGWIYSGLCLVFALFTILVLQSLGLLSRENFMPKSVVVRVDAAKQYQTIEGFGTCLISWEESFRQLFKTPEFQQYYVEDLGATLLRMEIWPDVSLNEIENWQDISYEAFDFSGRGLRGQVFVDFIEAIHELGPDPVRLIGSVWSPPGWMKENGKTNNGNLNRENFSIKGDPDSPYVKNNRLRPDRYQHFAKWLVEWVKLLQSKGIELYALSPQNEPLFSQWYNSAVYDAKAYQQLIKTIGEMFELEGIKKPLIFGPEHVTHDWEWTEPYLTAIMSDQATASYFDVIASHGYTDGVGVDQDPRSPGRFFNFIKDYNRPYWMTETGTGDHDWPGPLKGLASQLHYSLVDGQASAFLPWQVVDSNPGTENLMLPNQPTAKTYAAMHFFKFIRPGAVRIDTDPSSAQLQISAFLDDVRKMLTVIVLNRNTTDMTLTLTFENLPQAYPQLAMYRTTAVDRLTIQPAPSWVNHQVDILIPGLSLITLQARQA